MSSTIFFFFFIPLLSFILLAVNLIFAPHNPYMEKNSAFECGFSSFLGQNRTQFSISFFIFALLFLLFDLEILLVYPYLVSAYTNEIYGLATMLIFLLALTLGFAYELGKKALTIDSRQMVNHYKHIPSRTSVITNYSLLSKHTGMLLKKSYVTLASRCYMHKTSSINCQSALGLTLVRSFHCSPIVMATEAKKLEEAQELCEAVIASQADLANEADAGLDRIQRAPARGFLGTCFDNIRSVVYEVQMRVAERRIAKAADAWDMLQKKKLVSIAEQLGPVPPTCHSNFDSNSGGDRGPGSGSAPIAASGTNTSSSSSTSSDTNKKPLSTPTEFVQEIQQSEMINYWDDLD